MKKPIIGITSSFVKETLLRNYYRVTTSIDYIDVVLKAGGIPIILPVIFDRESIKEQLDLIDGLLIPGGADVSPHLYGQDFLEGITRISPEMDKNNWTILEEFIPTKKPILGICRGMQILNVFHGGSLFQDLRYAQTSTLQHMQDFYPDLEVHKVKFEEKSILKDIFGYEIMTNSFHHQVIDNLGGGLKVAGRTADGYIEAIEGVGDSFMVGVQWHPEMMANRENNNMLKLFKEFVKRSKR